MPAPRPLAPARQQGDAEIDQHRRVAAAQDDVVGLEVAVDHARAMDRGERERDARERRQAVRAIEAGFHRLAQGRAFDELLDQQSVAALQREQAEHTRNPRMVEPRGRGDLGARGLHQLLARLRIVVLAARRALDRDLDAELRDRRRETHSCSRSVPGMADRSTTAADPVTLQIVANGLGTVADEMATTIFRTAHSTVVRDAMDFSAALCGATGETVAQAVTIVPFQLGSIRTSSR